MTTLDSSRHQVLLEAGLRARFFRRQRHSFWWHPVTKEAMETEQYTTREAWIAEYDNMTANGWVRHTMWLLVEVQVD